MGSDKEKDEMEEVETISPEQAKKEMREAVKHVHEEEAKHPQSSSKRRGSTQKEDMDDVETISPQQAKKEMREAVKHVHEEESKKKKK